MKNKQVKENYYEKSKQSPTKQKNLSSNQFSNITNRVDLISRTSTKKTNELTPKKRRDHTPQIQQNNKHYQNQELATFYIPNNQQNQQNYQNKDNWVRKQGGVRRRQFDIKLGNIQKMSCQMNNLLDMIKNNEHRRVIKQDQNQQKSMTPRGKIKSYQQNFNQKQQKSTYVSKYNQIFKQQLANTQKIQKYQQKNNKKYQFITEGAKQKNKSRRKLKEQLQQQNKQKQTLFNKTTIVHKSYIQNIGNKEKKKQRSPLKKYNYKQISQKDQNHYYSKELINDKRPISSILYNDQVYHKQKETSRFSHINKFNQEDLKIATSKMQVSQDLPKFCHNYQSPAIKNGLDKINKSDFSSRVEVENISGRQSVQGYTNIDQQISRIKSRIQCSEQKTRKMQQKYLYTEQKPGKLYNISELDEKNERIKKRYYEVSNQFQKIDKQVKQTEPQTKNFQIKIYPCQSNTKQKVINCISQNLAGQIKLDQNLRVCRQKFTLIQNSDKWSALRSILSKQGIHYSEKQLQQELIVSSSQYNPFHKNMNQKPLDYIEQIAQSFIKCQQFWRKKVSGCIKQSELQSSGFKINEIDLDKKGHLSVQDFVCFVNLNSTNFFRNRDVMTLYRRFMYLGKNKSGVDYEDFRNKICCK